MLVQDITDENLEISVIIPHQGIFATRAATSSASEQREGAAFRVAQKVWQLWNSVHYQDVCEALPRIESPRSRFCDGTRFYPYYTNNVAYFDSKRLVMLEDYLLSTLSFSLTRSSLRSVKRLCFTKFVCGRLKLRSGLRLNAG